MTFPFKLFYADYLSLPLPAGHRFPADKYFKTRDLLQKKFAIPNEAFVKSPLASFQELCKVHDPDYVSRVFKGTLSRAEIRKIGFPWSPQLADRCRASTGGTLAAAISALNLGYSAQLAGGTHHAHYNSGGGYCVFNDFAYATNHLRSTQLVNRIAIIDLDVHHGDGNASMLKDDNETFVLSMHGEKNYPLKKPPSDLDIPLPDKVDDEFYLNSLAFGLTKIQEFSPDFILYQGGVDPLYCDALGRMNVTHDGLYERDRQVFSLAKQTETPIVHVLGGGYARPIEPTVQAYVNTFAAAFDVFLPDRMISIS